ncbi:hypothetical protein DFH07DRAFT_1056810 [Mycena maculata]|uniref:Uncharacterized protein n=1 Tax=Mycena maculata TaxID=230809 RepID=A0AAD7K4N5_9AGAR|nr:hypothetical protein DFH07DRAFT_1056810 [Mycena maculata]
MLWITVNKTGRPHISWFAKNGYGPGTLRHWAEPRGLAKRTVVKKDQVTACREASAILAEVDDVVNARKFDSATVTLAGTRDSAVVPKVDSSSKDKDPDHPDHPTTLLFSGQALYDIPSSWSPPTDDDNTQETAMLEHPCFTNPHPVSRIQPHITSTQKEITVPALPARYPYHLELVNGSYRIPYLQFLGRGPPTENLDVGTPGDVYLDLTPGAFALYGKTATGWQRWYDSGDTFQGNKWPDADWVVKHPHLDDFGLWVTFSQTDGEPGHIRWYKGTGSPKNARSMALKLGVSKKSRFKVNGDQKVVESSAVLEYVFGGRKLERDLTSGSSSMTLKMSLKRERSPVVSSPSKKQRCEGAAPLPGPFSMYFG